jgi:hypothetical protein
MLTDRGGRHRRRPRSATTSSLVGGAAALLVTSVVVGGIFLWQFAVGDRRYPSGFDTPKYFFRANAVIAEGVGALEHITPPSLNLGTNPERPGHPTVAAIIDGSLGVDPFELSLILPAVMAVAIGLAAGSFAVQVLRESEWAFPVFAIATGGSVLVARTAVGSADNLIIDSIALAFLGCSVTFADRDRGLVGALLLAAGGMLVHWNLMVIAFALLAGVTVVYAIPSLLRWRGGARAWHTPAPRLAALLGMSAVAGAAALFTAPALPTKIPHVGMPKIRIKNADRLPAMRLPFSVAVAAMGGAVAWLASGARRRMGLILLVGWAASVPIAALLLEAGRRIPVYRVAAFALALPMLGAALITTPARLLARRMPLGGIVLSLVLGVTLLGATLTWTARFWFKQETTNLGGAPRVVASRMEQSMAAGRYLEGIGEVRPAIFLASTAKALAGKLALPDHLIRGGVPPGWVDDVYVFPGSLEELQALRGGADEVLSDPTVGRRSLEARAVVQQILDEAPVVLFLTSFGGGSGVPATQEVAPGVFVVEGPASGPVAQENEVPGRVVGNAIALGVLLMVVGMGWSMALTSGSILVRLGFAMPFALSSLALVGTVVGRVVPLSRSASIATLAAVGGIGWLTALRRELTTRRGSPRSDPPHPPVTEGAAHPPKVGSSSTSDDAPSTDATAI